MKATSAAPRRAPGSVRSLDSWTDPLLLQKGDLRPEVPGKSEGGIASAWGSQRDPRPAVLRHQARRARRAPRFLPHAPADGRRDRRCSSAEYPLRARGRDSPSQSHFPSARLLWLRLAHATSRSVSWWPDRLPDQQSPGAHGTSYKCLGYIQKGTVASVGSPK